ncbi:MAG: amino acid ABC transporter substrate-binding protein [Hyphomicrobiales bacterium]|nr:amino acid ABC transporter substrate-binding protein [Hyphomicrobiales bacterium]
MGAPSSSLGLKILCAAAVFSTLAVSVAGAATLDTVKQRGTLTCGVSQGLPGFSDRDAQGNWSGFDVDFCRAVAAAVFNDPKKVTFVPLSAVERFDALKDGKIDVLSRNSTWTLEREAGSGLLFASVMYYDGQGFMVARRLQVTSALELDKASVCVQKGTTTALNLADFFRANSMTYRELAFDTLGDAIKAFDTAQCDVFTSDQSALYANRLGLSKPESVEILPDVISKEPLGPVVRSDDVAWFNIVKWVGFALVDAEELGIGASNLSEALASTKPDAKRFTGADGDFGRKLGLDNAWALQAVKAVGHYGEMFERNIGSQSRLGVPRGLNQLWSQGGILYAPPLR